MSDILSWFGLGSSNDTQGNNGGPAGDGGESGPAATEVGAVYVNRSHHRVCRVKRRIDPTDKLRRNVEEYVFSPASLVDLCLHVVNQNEDLKSLVMSHEAGIGNDDVRALLDAHTQDCHPENCKWDAKLRSCESFTGVELRVGGFAPFHPALRDRAVPEMFSVDLAATTRRVLTNLYKIASLCRDAGPGVVEASIARYAAFVQLQEQTPDAVLTPPVDVAMVWYSHILNTAVWQAMMTKYKVFSALPHPWTEERSLDSEAWEDGLRHTEALWTSMDVAGMDGLATDQGPFLLSVATESDAGNPALQVGGNWEGQSLATVQGDLQWITEFQASVGGAEQTFVFEDAFLAQCLEGYGKFLYLLGKIPQTMEAKRFSPFSTIDAVYHAHIASGAPFWTDTMALLDRIPHHKLLPVRERTEIFYAVRTNEEEVIWQAEFAESLFGYLDPPLSVSAAE